MASSIFYKFNQFVEDLGNGLHNFDTDSIMALLTNTVPNIADTICDTSVSPCVIKSTSNAVEITPASGYTKKGLAVGTPVWAQISGVAKFYGVKVLWTAGASIGPFRYAVFFNDSKGAAATRPLIGWYDYNSGITLGVGETFAVGNSNDGTDWTVTYPICSVT
jgi:hypothetical protein